MKNIGPQYKTLLVALAQDGGQPTFIVMDSRFPALEGQVLAWIGVHQNGWVQESSGGTNQNRFLVDEQGRFFKADEAKGTLEIATGEPPRNEWVSTSPNAAPAAAPASSTTVKKTAPETPVLVKVGYGAVVIWLGAMVLKGLTSPGPGYR